MDVISPNEFCLESLHVSSLLYRSRINAGKKPLNKNQQEILFNAACVGLIETWNVDENSCIEALTSITIFACSYEIPNSQHSESIANIVMELLNTNYERVVQNALLLVSNVFSQKKLNLIGISLLKNDIVQLIHKLFIKWERSIFPEILYILSNLAATSSDFRNLILYNFNTTEIKDLLLGIHNYGLIAQNKYRIKCQAFLSKLHLYYLNIDDAINVFNLLAELRNELGSWIFEQMGLCFKWIKDKTKIHPSLFNEAFELLSSDSNEDIRSALIFISYTTKDINEAIINLVNNENDEISGLALWSINNFIRSKGQNAVQICKEYNIFQNLLYILRNGSYRKKTECGYCLCDIIKVSTFADRIEILSIGLFSELAEILIDGGDDNLSKEIIQVFTEFLSHQENAEIITEVIKIIDEKNIYDKVSNEENSSNQQLAEASTKLLRILDAIE